MKELIISVFMTVLLPFNGNHANAQDFNNVDVVKTIDGDTIKVDLRGEKDLFGKNISIRFRGINTEELRSKSNRAYGAKEYVKYSIEKSSCVSLKNCTRGKYFRLVCDVYLDNVNLNQELLDNGLADKYDY